MNDKYTIQEGLESLDRIRLIMGYDLSKSLNENKLLISEIDIVNSQRVELKIPNKNVSLPANSTSGLIPDTNLTWSVINKGNSPITIQKVDVIPSERTIRYFAVYNINASEFIKGVCKVTFTKESIKPNFQGYVIVNVNLLRMSEKIKMVHPKYMTPSLPKPKDPGAVDDGDEFDFNLLITTSAGQIKTSLRSGDYSVESEVAKKQREVKEKILQRKTPNLGITTPEGFSPFSYEDFITELYDTISNRYSSQGQNCNYQSYYKKYISSDPILSKKYPQPSNLNKSENVDFCDRKFKLLLEKYYSEKFPTGITPDDKEEFDKLYSQAKSELETFKKQHMVTRSREPFDEYFDENRLSPELQKKYKELVAKVKGVESEYGFDDRNSFDKWWEEYGIWAQVGVGILTLIASFGASSPAVAGFIASTIGSEVAAVTTALGAAERFSILADFYMNASVGTYQLAKGDTKEAMLSFFFAALPKIHNLYSKIGKVFGKPSVEVTKSLANKIGQVSLSTRQDINAFIATLSKEEAKYFKSALKLSREDYETAFKLIQQDMEKTLKPVSKGVKVAKGTGKFLGTASIDFTVIATAQELYEAAVNQINKYCKNCMTTEDEKKKAKTYLNKLSPNQIKNLGKFLNMIQENEIAQEVKGKEIQMAITGQLNQEIDDFNNQVMSNDEILKKMKEKLKSM
jgi:hypothetical protein